MAVGEERYHNRAAVLHLSGPDYATPAVDSFEAVLPRPHVSRGRPCVCIVMHLAPSCVRLGVFAASCATAASAFFGSVLQLLQLHLDCRVGIRVGYHIQLFS
jgi:hypothetical protein